MRGIDTIEYELQNLEEHEVWKCDLCRRYRHRPHIIGALPAICCGHPARLIDNYELPVDLTVAATVRAR